ncbi:uncharacterized protein LOC141905942 [Tubulanus polymorphus]|uniref:uncharacterized protein LOC141905942 n=1 Tax=Tubulanus polymorphus TaxID=672921 RepID=UPI003DA30118
MAAGLYRASSIDLVTDEGHHEIQLLLGDITLLPPEDKVDLLMISAFPGDYCATPTSVIGALKRSFGINVRDLARDKAEDLRRNFNCWFSHPLPDGLPYKRLLCFEQQVRDFSHPSMLIGDVFRCMIPAFNNQPSSVITPILASGDQNCDINVMLTSMVVAACNWITAGLPLVCLKIVVFTREQFTCESDIKSSYLNGLIDVFNKQKLKWESRKTKWKEVSIQYDVFLSYSREDQDYVEMIRKQLLLEKPGLRINTEKHELDLEQAWQQEIYDTMIVCLRVLPVLTQNYLTSLECVEEYNIALCCNRVSSRDILAPFLLKTIPQLPVYMQLIQYLDCRIDDGSFDKLITGCRTFVKSELSAGIKHATAARKQTDYDVFISYCHKNTNKVALFLETLQKLKPDLKIFFDRNELKTGASWQQILYGAIESSDVVLVMLTPDYMNSSVCCEEYNLALACHTSSAVDVNLVPVLIEDVDESLQRGYSYVPVVDGRNTHQIASIVCQKIINFLDNGEIDPNIFQTNKTKHHLDWLMAKNRNSYFRENFTRKAGKFIKKPVERETTADVETTHENRCDIFISVNDSDKIYASCLRKILKFKSDELEIHFDTESEASQLSKLERAKIIVAVVSPAYFTSKREQQEFHSALCRHRAEIGKQVLYVIQMSQLLDKPSYAHLIPCDIACYDSIWKDLSWVANQNGVTPFTEAADKVWYQFKCDEQMNMKIFTALDAASEVIIELLTTSRSEEKNMIIRNIIAMDMKVDPKERIPIPDGFIRTITTKTETGDEHVEKTDVMDFRSEKVHVLDFPEESTGATETDECTNTAQLKEPTNAALLEEPKDGAQLKEPTETAQPKEFEDSSQPDTSTNTGESEQLKDSESNQIVDDARTTSVNNQISSNGTNDEVKYGRSRSCSLL